MYLISKIIDKQIAVELQKGDYKDLKIRYSKQS